MCGIAGFIVSQSSVNHQTALRGMAAAIAHRGPDDEGFLETATRDGHHRIGLAHRRLSIIDLATGHQPMGNEDDTVQVVFNGEIYNFQSLRNELIALGYRFVTTSDTETIVHAYEQWGERCVERFCGMFAFAIWDACKERLFLARDRFGKKPLYFYRNGEQLLFASEIKSILAFPGVKPEIDMASVWDYFSYRYVPAPDTLFRGVRKLMPGSYAFWRRGGLHETRYYHPPDTTPWGGTALPADPVAAFLKKLDDCVHARMVSDVPFGAFLSGGIDSSAIVALMSRHSELPVQTFSVGFKGNGGYSELDYARIVAEEFRTDHHELIVSPDHLMTWLPELVRFRDAPVSEPSDIPIYLLSVEARRRVKMVLTGEGADEFLGGYPKHVFEHYVQGYQQLLGFVHRGLLQPLVQSLPYRFQRAKTAIVNLGLESFEERMPRWFGALSEREKTELIALEPPRRPHRAFQFDHVNAGSPLRRILAFDQLSWLPDNLLERGDRMTMAASLEARMPYMDHELAALVSSLPDHYRVRGKATKWILHEAMKPILPGPILNRPKVGFRVAVNEWFRGPMRDYLYEHLAGPGSMTADYYRRPALEKVLADHVAGRHNHEKLLWSLLNLEIWHRQYAGNTVARA